MASHVSVYDVALFCPSESGPMHLETRPPTVTQFTKICRMSPTHLLQPLTHLSLPCLFRQVHRPSVSLPCTRHSPSSQIMVSIPTITPAELSLGRGSASTMCKFVVPRCGPSWTIAALNFQMPTFTLMHHLLVSEPRWILYLYSVHFLHLPLTWEFRQIFYGSMTNTLTCRREKMQQRQQPLSARHF